MPEKMRFRILNLKAMRLLRLLSGTFLINFIFLALFSSSGYATITAGSSTNQPAFVSTSTVDAFMGSVSIVRDAGSVQVTSVTVKENGGTIDADTELENVELWLSSDDKWDAGDDLLETAQNFNGPNGECTFTENFNVDTSTQYLIVRLDVKRTAGIGETIKIQISTITTTDPVNGTPLDIPGTTTIVYGKTIGIVCDARPQKTKNQSALTTDLNNLNDQVPSGWVIDCVQNIGDMDYLTYGATTYDGAFSASEVRNLPSFYLMGNHEAESSSDPPALWGKFLDYPDWNLSPGPPGSSSSTYSYDVGDIHVVVLNEYWDGNNDDDCEWTPGDHDTDDTCYKYGSGEGGYIPDGLLSWLKTDLRNSTAPYKIVFGHEPAWPESWQRHNGDSLDQDAANRNKFWNLLQTERVIAYFCGHTHNYKFQEYDGVFEVDGGVSGGMLGGGGPGENDNFATLLYAHYDNNGFVIRAVNEGGSDWGGSPIVTTKGIMDLINQVLVNTAEGVGTASTYFVNRSASHPDWSAYNESRWWEIAFDTAAAGWSNGELCVGYDNNGGAWPWMNSIVTVPPTPNVYGVFQRVNFTVYDKASYDKLYLGVDYDDALTVWLNDTEIFKSGNSPTVGTNDIWDKTASSNHGASGDGDPNPVYTIVDVSSYMGNLNEGTTNLLAVGNWNRTTDSSDIAAGIKLYLARAASISSAQNQTFVADGPTTAISAITITESGTATTITAGKDIRIKIPSTLYMTWDTSNATANIGGTDYDHTGAAFQGAEVNVAYEDSDKTVVIPVETDFEAGDDITVYGLSFRKFTPMSAEDNLELVTGGSGDQTVDTDDKTITIVISLIYPYLQDGTTTSVKVMWITDASSASRVDYGLTGSYGSYIEDPSLVTVHEIPITGLSPNTIYHYKATSGEMSSSDSTFRTAPSSDSGFTFIAYGDNRASGSGPVYVTDHEAVINAMIPHNPRTMIINVGDLCYDGSEDEWKPQLFLPARNMLKNNVFYPVIGNHEYNTPEGPGLFEDYFEPPEGSGSEFYYSFNYGNAHFVILDTNQNYTTGSAQHNWLLSDLDSESATSATWIFVTGHHPAFSTDGETAGIVSHLVPVFEDKGVDMYICGHDHFYERNYVNGVYYLITGGGGAPIRDPGSADYMEFNKKALHHCLFEVDARVIIVTAYGNDGAAFDSFVLPHSTAETVVPGAGKTIVFNSLAGEVRVEIPPQTFSESVTITVGTVISFPSGISPGGLRGTGVGIEIIPDKPVQPLKSIMISVPYRPSDVAGMNEDRLVLAGYDSWDRAWVPLHSDNDTLNNRVTALTSHLSIFQIMQSAIEDLSQVTIGPNPLRPSRNPGDVMTFRNLPEGARVRIYTLTGELLHDAHESANGTAVWNGRNKSGRQVASGVYIALIEGKGERRRFKLAVQK